MQQMGRNCARVGRKPIPVEVSKAVAKQAKEYGMWKQAEKLMLDKEAVPILEQRLKTLDSLVFLPDYLLEEATTEYGEMNLEVNAEYNPMIVYLEQIMQVFPREMTAKHKMQPAFDESINKMNDE